MPLLGRVFLQVSMSLLLLGGGSAAIAAPTKAAGPKMAAVKPPAVKALTPQTSTDPGALVLKNTCAACHAPLPNGGYTRITQMRKTPEGWEITLNRMAVVHGVQLSAADKADVLKYLSDHFGLAPEEAAPYRAFLEQVPYVQDKAPDPFLSTMCARCHSFARIGLERRDTDEWLKLANFHLGQYPSAEYSDKGRGIEWWKLASTTVPQMLGKMYPFQTPEWTAWQKHADPDLSGIWRVTGHTPGKGDYQGHMFVDETTKDHYRATLTLTYADGSEVDGHGQALIYTGYEWRGTFTLGKAEVHQVLAVGADGGLSGRWFEATHPERGGTMTAYHETDHQPRIMQVSQPYLHAGDTAQIEIDGTGLSGEPVFGAGVQVERVVSHSPERIVVLASAAADAVPGARTVSVGATKADDAFVVYRAIDFVKVVPGDTIARVGNNDGPLPAVTAQFEAVGYLLVPGAGKGEQAVRIGVFPAAWSVSNYSAAAAARRDIRFAGRITATGEFEPAGAGPDPKRRFGGDNIGNLRVTGRIADHGQSISGDAHLIVTVQRWITQPIF